MSLFLKNEDKINVSFTDDDKYNLETGGYYQFNDLQLKNKDILVTLFLKSLQSDFPVMLVSRDKSVLTSFAIYHKILRKSRKIDIQNGYTNIAASNSVIIYPEPKSKNKNNITNSTILLIDKDSLDIYDIDYKSFINNNCINIIFSSKDNGDFKTISQTFIEDLSPHSHSDKEIVSSFNMSLGEISIEFNKKIITTNSEIGKKILEYRDVNIVNEDIRYINNEAFKQLEKQKI